MRKSCYGQSKPTPAPEGVLTPGLVGLDGQPYVIPDPQLSESSSVQNLSNFECGVYGETQQNANMKVKKPKVPLKPKGLNFTSPIYEKTIAINTRDIPNSSGATAEQAQIECRENPLCSNNSFQDQENVYDMAHDVPAEEFYEDDDDFSDDDFSDDDVYYANENGTGEPIYFSLDPYQGAQEIPNGTSKKETPVHTGKDDASKTKPSHIVLIIKEFIETEQAYLRDLDIIVDNVMKPLAQRQLPDGVKMETLFGNIEDVRMFTVAFLASLDAATLNTSYEDARIARVFVEHADRMKEVYKIYCRNQDDSNALQKKYKNVPQFQIPITECLNNAKNEVSICTLDSLLVKPTQRVLKYPLLLKELLKNTPMPQPGEDASYYREVMQANKTAGEIAVAINQAKRGKDLAKRYRQRSRAGGEIKQSGSIIRGIRKKTKRFSVKIRDAISKQNFEDEEFNRIEKDFRNLSIAVANFLGNSDHFLNDYEELLNSDRRCAEELSDFFASDQNQALTSYIAATKRIANVYFIQFRTSVKHRVMNALTMLDKQLKEPQSIIDKRADKLLDYENSLHSSDSKENIQMAKDIYEALNQQLLDDIPKLCEFAYKLLDTCFAEMVRLQIRFSRDSIKMLEESFKLLQGTDASLDEVEKMKTMKHFNFVQNQVLFQMKPFSIVPASFTEKLNEEHLSPTLARSISARRGTNSTQHPEHRQHVLAKYNPDDLFLVVADYWSPSKTDLICSRDDLLGVIKRQDPAGNNNVWFCDNGVCQGFIPSSMLKFSATFSPTNSRRNENSHSNHSADYASVTYSRLSSFSNRSSVYDQISSPQTFSSLQRPGSVYHPSVIQYPSKPKPAPPPKPKVTLSPKPSPYSLREGLYEGAGEIHSSQVYDKIPAGQRNDLLQDEDDMLDDSEYRSVSSSKIYRFAITFNFTSRSPLELSVVKGELVNVILQHDKDGNTEWWLVVNKEGKQGFVPHNFIRKID